MNWLWQNKEWFFQGLGALLIMAGFGLLGRKIWKRTRGDATDHSQSQRVSAEGSLNLGSSALAMQAASSGGMNVNIRELHQGLGVAQVNELALSLWEANFPKLKDEAVKAARGRVESFLSELTPRLTSSLTKIELDSFRAPEVQYSFNQALQAAALRPEAEPRNTLADLIIKQVRATPSEGVARIVYTEAIKTVPKLTVAMLNILALKAFMWRGDLANVRGWQDLTVVFKKYLIPFLGFTGSYVDFQHIAYTGCGSTDGIRVGPSGFVTDLREKCPWLFQRELSAAELDALKLGPELNLAIFESGTGGKFRFKPHSKTALKQLMNTMPLALGLRDRVLALHDESLGRENDSLSLLLAHVPESREVIEKWSKSLMNLMSLTSVGAAIGASYFEAVTGLGIGLELDPTSTPLRSVPSNDTGLPAKP